MERIRIEVIDRTYAAILAAKTPAERAWMIGDCHKSANRARRRRTHSPPDLDRAANLTCGLQEDRRWSRFILTRPESWNAKYRLSDEPRGTPASGLW